jgi:periplasmic protein TonB
MPTRPARPLDLDDEAPEQPGRLSANAHWMFGSLYALLALIGFAFGVWAGAQKPRPVEVAEAKKEPGEKAPETQPDKPAPKPPAVPPAVNPTPPEPKPMEPEPKPKEPEPKPMVKEPEPKPKEPEPKPKEPEPKPPEVKPVAFKEVVPILRRYCFDCHGAAGKPKGDVDLTTLAKIRDSKKMPVVPGKPKESGLYTSVVNGDMPPEGKKGPTPEELKVLHDWIASGAKERRRGVRGRRKLELTRRGGAG